MKHQGTGGFTLIETLIAASIFVIVATAIYFSYSNILDIVNASNYNSTAFDVIEAELEVIRSMTYRDIGIQGGSPPGSLLATKSVDVDGLLLTVNTAIRNIDDPFDGTASGSPVDLAPADYKQVQIEVTCPGCQKFLPARTTTTAAPKSLESASKNGSLFVNVINANGQPVSGANVSVVNNAVTPAINMNDTTGLNGQLQLVDIATSSGGYQLTVSKSGYSTDRTYAPGNPANPVKPHATVAQQQLTLVSFAIDRVGTLNFVTQDEFCRGVANIDFQQTGAKLIGTDPDTPKYSVQHATDATGNKQVTNLEWDTYSFTDLDGGYDIAGYSQASPFIVDPNQTYTLTWNMASASPFSLLATVRDAQGQAISDATVTLSRTGFEQTEVTGRHTLTDTDWSGSDYDSKSGNTETDSPAGQVSLVDLGGGTYASNSQEWLISKTVDLGTSTATLHTLRWDPSSQPPPAGADSLKFQLAANNDNATWNFTGPDGTAGTYYTSAGGTTPYAGLNDKRYIRYKLYLRTDSDQHTPSLNDVSLVFSSSCSPGNQTLFQGLDSGTYTITVSKSGYQTFTDTNVSITGSWQEYPITLTP